MNREQTLILVIALLSTLILLVVFILSFIYIHKAYMKKHAVKVYGKKLYEIAQEKDFMLINEFGYRFKDGSTLQINHILFGDKYIYVIEDKYINGGVSAREEDNCWVKFTKKKKQTTKKFINNPLQVAKNKTDLLGAVTRFNDSLFISIVLINNECEVTDFEQTSEKAYLVSLKKLKKLINSIESRNVSALNEDQLKEAVLDIAKLNINKKQ